MHIVGSGQCVQVLDPAGVAEVAAATAGHVVAAVGALHNLPTGGERFHCFSLCQQYVGSKDACSGNGYAVGAVQSNDSCGSILVCRAGALPGSDWPGHPELLSAMFCALADCKEAGQLA